MRRIRLCLVVAIAVTLSNAAAAQTVAPASCSFDTAAHTDMLSLEFSLKAFRGKDTIPDPVLTAGLGDLMRPRFAPSATIGQLLYPNTYLPSGHGFSSIFGTMQFEMTPLGVSKNLKWYAASLDQATDDAVEKALDAALKSEDAPLIAGGTAWKGPQQIRVQFLATDDAAVHSALARMKVPMVRVDSGGKMIPGPKQAPILVPRDMIRTADDLLRTEFEAMVDPSGHVIKESVQIISAPSKGDTPRFLAYVLSHAWNPGWSGGCPVNLRVHFRQGNQPG